MKSLRFLNSITNKRIFIRSDFNVPLKNNIIIDDFKIEKSLETIKYINNKNPKMIILASHLGRPNGSKNKNLLLKPIADSLSDKLKQTIYYGNKLKQINNLPNNSIILLENLRFHIEEEEDNLKFAKTLASFGDIYINDAFAVSHRKHASVSNILNFFPDNNKFNGFLLEKEKRVLDELIYNKKRPFVIVLGGSKIKDKITLIKNLLLQADNILIGGALSYCFLKAKGHNIGSTPCYDEDVVIAKQLLEYDIDNKIILRVDHIVAGLSPLHSFQTPNVDIPNDLIAYDIGNNTLKLFNYYLKDAKQIFWNGPMGMYEEDKFKRGSIELIKIITHSKNCESLVIGGGETSDIFRQFNYSFNNTTTHILTGGGASLEYLSKIK